MNTGDVPVVLLLLLPGFLLIQVYGWTAYKREVSDFEGLLWSLVASFATLVPCAIAWHEIDDHVPTLGIIVRDPRSLPLRVAASTYILAPILGWTLGWLERHEVLERYSLKIGIDLRRREDIWNIMFRESCYAVIHLKSGENICGCVTMSSTTRRQSLPELYVTDISVWDRESDAWTPRDDLLGTWMEASSIERLDLFTPDLQSAANVDHVDSIVTGS